jgi:hypothetical protein
MKAMSRQGVIKFDDKKGAIKSINRTSKAMTDYIIHPTDSGIETQTNGGGDEGGSATGWGGAGGDSLGAGGGGGGGAGPEVMELYKPKKEIRELFNKVRDERAVQ